MLNILQRFVWQIRMGFCWKNDLCFNVRIGDNRVKVVRSDKKEEVLKTNDLK
jgi:hypothetical protein